MTPRAIKVKMAVAATLGDRDDRPAVVVALGMGVSSFGMGGVSSSSWLLSRARRAINESKVAAQVIADPLEEHGDFGMPSGLGRNAFGGEPLRPLVWVHPTMVGVLTTYDDLSADRAAERQL